MNWGTTFLTRLHVHPVNSQINLRRAVGLEPSHGALRVTKDRTCLQADNEDYVGVFAGRHKNVWNAVTRLISYLHYLKP